ncbi:MAG: hypothetical protein ACUVXJ_14210 [Phycisphaerae bacterium]
MQAFKRNHTVRHGSRTNRAVFLCILGLPALSPAASAVPATEPGRSIKPVPAIGMWYTVWWTKDDQFKHWVNRHVLPTRGPYTAGDPQIIAAHYAQLRDLGVDFLIMDDTNCVGNDGGRINDNIRAWFDFMDRLAATERILICIGGGGEMREEGAKGQSRAADVYWQAWAQRPSYFHLDGKPLLLVDTDDNYGPGDWDDSRFAVRWAYNGDNCESMARRKTWGWGSCEPAPILAESMSIWPGHRFPRHVAEQGQDPLEEPREGGRLYVRMWLRVLQARPRFVTIADYNNFEEETASSPAASGRIPMAMRCPTCTFASRGPTPDSELKHRCGANTIATRRNRRCSSSTVTGSSIRTPCLVGP